MLRYRENDNCIQFKIRIRIEADKGQTSTNIGKIQYFSFPHRIRIILIMKIFICRISRKWAHRFSTYQSSVNLIKFFVVFFMTIMDMVNGEWWSVFTERMIRWTRAPAPIKYNWIEWTKKCWFINKMRFQQPMPNASHNDWKEFQFLLLLCRLFIRFNFKFDELKLTIGDQRGFSKSSSAQWQSAMGRNGLMINE